jgi:hypothetical protein
MILNLFKRKSSSLFDWLLGELIRSFLKNNASQLTIYGYVDLLWHYITSSFFSWSSCFAMLGTWKSSI